MRSITLTLVCVLLPLASAGGQGDVAGFDSDSWTMVNAETVQHMGREGLIGFALLRDFEFQNGVIEVDVAVDGTRSYPGIVFRVRPEGNYERVYIRPHRAGLYPDAIQYTPVFNGIAGWQLYNGEGYTAGVIMPADEWVHVRVEVKDKQARVFVGESDAPALIIEDLKHGVSRGSVGLMGPRDMTACFSNFSCRPDDSLEFGQPLPVETPPGMITEWELSERQGITRVETDKYPGKKRLAETAWQKITSEPSGLVDVGRYFGRGGREPDCVFARATVLSEKTERRKFLIGYSDQVNVFLNGELLFSGSSMYQERDPSFLGVLCLSDAVYLPLEKGENELLLAVTETFGGWGFKCQDATVVFEAPGVERVWTTDKEFLVPESATYDPGSGFIYVSNFDAYNRSADEERQFISRLSIDGTIENLKWVTGLNNPTGLAVHEKKLFAVERRSLAEIDLKTGALEARYPFPQPVFPNDVTVDESGVAYVTDSGKNVIYRVVDGEVEVWLSGSEIERPNGICAHDGRLLVGNNGDRCVKSIDVASKKISLLARLGPGIIDGIRTDGRGNYIVSQVEGRVYRISPSGEKVRLLDTSPPGQYTADLEYVVEKRLLVIPAFADNRVAAYRLEE